MNLTQAEADWIQIQDHLKQRCAQAGLEYRPPSYIEHDAYVYEQLSGDAIPRSEISESTDLAVQLKLWVERYKRVRGISPELDSWLIDKINASRRGDV